MSLVVFDNVGLHFGPKTILEDASFRIDAGERVGLVGRNGTGKSTLLKMLAGRQECDAGRVIRSKGLRIGYLTQDITDQGDNTLLRTIVQSAPGKAQIEEHLAAVEANLHTATEADEQMELAAELARLHEELAAFERLYAPHEAESILIGLGFTTDDFLRPMTEFSGGWRMRAALASLLYIKPDLLLLDEPTNHLDVPSLRWFERFLDTFTHAYILVSHDREFLNSKIRRVLSFEPEGLRSYTGNFEDYVEQREQELEILEAQAKNQERFIAQSERFINRFRAKATKARQVQSRIKQLEKIERVETIKDAPTLEFAFAPAERAGREVVKIRGLKKNFDEVKVFDGLSLTVQRGERIALIGPNGCGKTTLLRLIAGEYRPDGGSIELGANVKMSYYAQHQTEQLKMDNTILDEVWSADLSQSQTRVRSICGIFLFTGDDVFKKCSVLSGGERARVVLAKLLMAPGNVLLMDEPTNHLDLYAAEALADALETFDGTLVFVSHNRSFTNRLANTIWDLTGGELAIYPGNLADYDYHLSQRESATIFNARHDDGATLSDHRPTAPPAERVDKKEARRQAAEKRAKEKEVLGPLEKSVKDLEKRIEALEAEQAAMGAQLADPDFYNDGERSREVINRYGVNKTKLEELMARWEHKTEELERERARIGEAEG
ncbi:MAG: ATP-binding cassette domain-containing protein [Deltaproteobacteria bacterium]|nr:ATP-binding cassette domain-containing protein [Deltaproteobacteria bacterium]MCB9488676.1 ATP-binding cassette domain-containing protein [Deltaproteobacteria bacterium]